MTFKNTPPDHTLRHGSPLRRPPPPPVATQQQNNAIVSLMRICLEQHQHLRPNQNPQPYPLLSNNTVRGSAIVGSSSVRSDNYSQTPSTAPCDDQSAHEIWRMAHLQSILSEAVDICSDVESILKSKLNESSPSCGHDNDDDCKGPSKKD